MKMRILIISMSVVMSSPMVAMHRHAAPASTMYKKMAVVGGAILAAGYVYSWATDLVKTEIDLYNIQKEINKQPRKMHTWCIQKYDPERPMECERNSATYTNYSSIHEDRFNYAAFDNVERDLMIDYWQGKFGYVSDAEKKYEGDKESRVRQYFLDCILKEKQELEPHLDKLVNMSKYFGGWYNIRKEYKWLARKQKLNSLQQWQWSSKQYKNVNASMAQILHTDLFHLFLGKSMYGRVARAYWDLEKCYQRLEKIERCLIEKLKMELPGYIAEEARIKNRRQEHDKQDISFIDWIVSPFFSAS